MSPGSCVLILILLIDFSWQDSTDSLPIKDKNVLSLAKMGYTMEEASIAMERCGAYLIVYVRMYAHVCSYDAVACCFLKCLLS